MINLYYNFYTDKRKDRNVELLGCLAYLCNITEIDQVFILTEEDAPLTPPRSHVIHVDQRPTFQSIFDIITKKTADSDVNIIINSDCIIDQRDIRKLNAIPQDVAYCIRRRELLSISPLRLDRRRTYEWERKHLHDMQDCWVVRGKPKIATHVDFSMGTPGCDNRLAHEFQQAGYQIVDPYYSVRVYHLHRSLDRIYRSQSPVSGPYAYPKMLGKPSLFSSVEHWIWKSATALNTLTHRFRSSVS